MPDQDWGPSRLPPLTWVLTAEKALNHPWFSEVGASDLRVDLSFCNSGRQDNSRSKAFVLVSLQGSVSTVDILLRLISDKTVFFSSRFIPLVIVPCSGKILVTRRWKSILDRFLGTAGAGPDHVVRHIALSPDCVWQGWAVPFVLPCKWSSRPEARGATSRA